MRVDGQRLVQNPLLGHQELPFKACGKPSGRAHVVSQHAIELRHDLWGDDIVPRLEAVHMTHERKRQEACLLLKKFLQACNLQHVTDNVSSPELPSLHDTARR